MRQKLHYFIYVVVLVTSVTFFGCNENAFDFSQLDEVDANGDWGFPLLNAEYTIGDILDMSGDIGYLQQGSDGTVELRYEYTFDSIISASKYLDSYFNQDISVEGSKTFSSFELPPVQGNVQLLEGPRKQRERNHGHGGSLHESGVPEQHQALLLAPPHEFQGAGRYGDGAARPCRTED